MAGFAQEIGDDPMLFALLDRLQFLGEHLVASQSTAEQEGDQRVVAESAQGERARRAEETLALFSRQPVS